MCEFISYVKKSNQLFYLTDDEIFSKEGREKLSGCQDNDFIGHGAIKKFFDIKGGEDHEVRDFWNTDKLPKELADKIANFDSYWGKTFKKYFMNDDLRYIISKAPEMWKSKASELLLTQNPSNIDLRYIVCYSIEKYKAKASEQLLAQNPSNIDLRDIICYSIKEYKSKAWEQLLTQNPSNYDLRDIVYNSTKEYKAKAWEQLLAQNPSNKFFHSLKIIFKQLTKIFA